jgi:hypothetical protein
MYYFYQDTIITVHPGIGQETYATVKRKASGSWETVKTPLMPRTECVRKVQKIWKAAQVY